MERAAAQAELRRAHEHEDLLQLLYLCPIAIVRLDAYGSIVLMNPHGTQILMPLSVDGNLSNLFDLVRPFAPEVGEMARRFSLPAGKICEDHRIVIPVEHHNAGTSTILSLTLQKVDDDILVGVIADVTASATRELKIRLSEERLHAVLDGVNEYAICTLDTDGSITSWNRSAERLYGFRIDEVMGRHVDMLAPATAHAGAFRRRIDQARRDGWQDFETWRVRKDGSRYWAHCTISTLHKGHEEGILGFSIITRDATARRRAEDDLRLLATTDPLTGALNRRAFLDEAKREEAKCGASGDGLTLLLLDVDDFKTVNDSFGHEAGDEVLVRIVQECRGELRSSDLIGRIGGDEFAIILTGANASENALSVAERIRSRIAKAAVARDGSAITVTVSVGLAGRDAACKTVDDMLRGADHAMYAAKHQGRDRISVASIGDAAARETLGAF